MSAWSSDVCSSDLIVLLVERLLTDRGAKYLQFRDRQALESLDEDQVDRCHAGQERVERRLVRAAVLVHQRPSAGGRQHRSGGRRVGKECVRHASERWSAEHSKQKKKDKNSH